MLVAALLLDTVEDTEATFEELAESFDAAIAEIVRQLTDHKKLPKDERKHLQIKHAAHSSNCSSSAISEVWKRSQNSGDVSRAGNKTVVVP